MLTQLNSVPLIQVKIWFQNRRAKERKINKKKLQQPASSTTMPTAPAGASNSGSGGGGSGSSLHGNSGSSVAMVTSSSGSNGLMSPSSLPLNIKEEYWGGHAGQWLTNWKLLLKIIPKRNLWFYLRFWTFIQLLLDASLVCPYVLQSRYTDNGMTQPFHYQWWKWVLNSKRQISQFLVKW